MDIARESIETYVYTVEMTGEDFSTIRIALSSASNDPRFNANFKAKCQALFSEMIDGAS